MGFTESIEKQSICNGVNQYFVDTVSPVLLNIVKSINNLPFEERTLLAGISLQYLLDMLDIRDDTRVFLLERMKHRVLKE